MNQETHPRNLKLVGIAKNLRKQQTDYETKLWYQLRDRRFENLKFRRQYPIKNYIVDFICTDKMLIIELDGGQHAENKKDIIRDNFLKAEGYTILRFWNNDVIQNMNGVLEMMHHTISSPSPFQGEGRGEGSVGLALPSPYPLPEREREKMENT